MANPYKNAPTVKLAEYIPAKLFRTILPEQRHTPCGISELPVEIQLKKAFAKTLSFKVPWDGLMYGFVRGKKEIFGRLEGFAAKSVSLQDWDDRFLLLFEGADKGDEKPFFVSPKDVKELLENCLRVPEQASIKKGR
ncbi:MAG: hypothetical protein NC299_14100 [Lachnospiraceae bacterium]|nr:hypothetical protein [Ruminococcus sp.]MCM1276469.1 hypothetical protein [Lachnospiraceae bacterium]